MAFFVFKEKLMLNKIDKRIKHLNFFGGKYSKYFANFYRESNLLALNFKMPKNDEECIQRLNQDLIIELSNYPQCPGLKLSARDTFDTLVVFTKSQIAEDYYEDEFEDLKNSTGIKQRKVYDAFNKWVETKGKQLDEMFFYASTGALDKVVTVLEEDDASSKETAVMPK